jgi:hypothetical protein
MLIGTGSGLTCKLLEGLFDHGGILPNIPIYSFSLLPFQAGDNPLQSYNTILSLAHMHEYTDAICIWSNDKLSKAAIVSGGSGADRKQQSGNTFTLLNRYAWSSMLGSLAVDSSDFWSVLELVCPDPNLKWIGFASTSASVTIPKVMDNGSKRDLFSDSWYDISKKLSRNLSLLDLQGSISGLLTVRACRNFPFLKAHEYLKHFDSNRYHDIALRNVVDDSPSRWSNSLVRSERSNPL